MAEENKEWMQEAGDEEPKKQMQKDKQWLVAANDTLPDREILFDKTKGNYVVPDFLEGKSDELLKYLPPKHKEAAIKLRKYYQAGNFDHGKIMADIGETLGNYRLVEDWADTKFGAGFTGTGAYTPYDDSIFVKLDHGNPREMQKSFYHEVAHCFLRQARDKDGKNPYLKTLEKTPENKKQYIRDRIHNERNSDSAEVMFVPPISHKPGEYLEIGVRDAAHILANDNIEMLGVNALYPINPDKYPEYYESYDPVTHSWKKPSELEQQAYFMSLTPEELKDFPFISKEEEEKVKRWRSKSEPEPEQKPIYKITVKDYLKMRDAIGEEKAKIWYQNAINGNRNFKRE